MLHNLRELRIFKGQNWEEFSWLQVRPQLAAELLRLIHSPILRSLQIRDIVKFPLRDFLLLGRSPHLTSLMIARLRFQADSEILTNNIDEGHNERQLESLGTSNVGESEENKGLETAAGDSGDSLHDLPRLQELCVGMESRNVLKITLGTAPDSLSRGHPLFDLSYIRKMSVVWMGTKCRAERLLIKSSSGVKALEVRLGFNISSFLGVSSPILRGSCRVLEKLTLSQRDELEAYSILDSQSPFLGVLKEMKLLAGNVTALSAIVIDFSLNVDMYSELIRTILWEVLKQCG
ncbi:hypothetical protein HYPSUDRAFT_50039 [Hypholoma sublateritium FD-334 SS-4]|uniref:F-box domain-containing protein n=1 Tax=Hypholoma sublateritium (strain FD-334 SS-4) TaxID=945553 RepID=A0A0D2KEV5_HYPSF|nr:hypothetical protein HYPSUDRAFT_50039 [Hypholoma sublateritium FD-334 SS-4]